MQIGRSDGMKKMNLPLSEHGCVGFNYLQFIKSDYMGMLVRDELLAVIYDEVDSEFNLVQVHLKHK